MAHIYPFRAWRYHADLTRQLAQLISPPFDTVSRQQREALYQHPYNSIHLSVPDAAHPPAQAAHDLQQWKNGILQQDPVLTLYGYYQYFTLEEDHTYCRKGFICFIEAAYWDEQVVLRHEDTLSPSVQDRADLLQATQLNASPTHGLYTDPKHRLEKYLDESMQQPLYEVEDYQGVRDVLSRITDPAVIQEFVQTLRDKPVILADGHHRYESSLIYRRAQEAQHNLGTGYKYHMMYLTNTESEDLRVLPTHRLVRVPPALSEAQVMQDLGYYFYIAPVEKIDDLPGLIAGKHWTFGLVWKDKVYQITLKEGMFEQFDRDLSPVVKALDTAVLHHFIIEKVLRITPATQRSTADIAYEQSFTQCQQQITEGVFTLAIITNGVSMEQIKQVCYTGQVMPPKTTYFYPKAITGFVFGSIKDEEL